MIQIKVVCILLSANGRAYFCKSIAIEMGGVSRYFSKILVSGVDVTLLSSRCRGTREVSGEPVLLVAGLASQRSQVTSDVNHATYHLS